MAYRVQSRVGVQAPAFAVWSVLSDLESWKDWNPVFTEAEGRLSIGAALQLRRVRSGGVGCLEEVRVVDWVPNEQILWARTLAPFARVLGFLEIEALTQTGCLLSVGEVFDGVVGERIGFKQRRVLTEGWRQVAEAAKARAEANWDGTPGEPPAPPPPPPAPKVKQQVMQLSILRPIRRR